MLPIDHPAHDIPQLEYFDNIRQEFITIPARHVDAIHLQLEHSLLSIAKWEGKWHTSFFSTEQMTPEQFLDYVRCMTINTQKNPNVYTDLTQEDFEAIMAYMGDQMSAIDVSAKKKKKSRKKETETAESVYFSMTQLGIPFDCEKWHINRLIALIDYCADHDGGGGGSSGSGANRPKSQKELMEFYHALNQKNRKKYNSKG